MHSNLAHFIGHHMESILSEWERFAGTLLPAGARLTASALRDHGEQILNAIQKDLQTPQTADEQFTKGQGLAVRALGSAQTAAETHALLRATDGFSLEQLVAEYRALRACVLKLWESSHPQGDHVLTEVGRFNEAIDQAVAESVVFFQQEVDRWRNVFLGVLGHELRAPLNAILLTSNVINRLTAHSPVGESSARLIRSGTRMAALLDDLLEYNRTSLGLGISVRRAACDLAEALREEVDLRRASLVDAEINLVAPERCPGVWDVSRLQQAVGNLVTNAVQHGTPGTPVTVCLERLADTVSITVENVGAPIPDDMKELIFEPLRRGTGEGDERSNMGLGLFVAREIVRSHNGSITAVSEGGKTRFTVVIPGGSGSPQ